VHGASVPSDTVEGNDVVMYIDETMLERLFESMPFIAEGLNKLLVKRSDTSSDDGGARLKCCILRFAVRDTNQETRNVQPCSQIVANIAKS